MADTAEVTIIFYDAGKVSLNYQRSRPIPDDAQGSVGAEISSSRGRLQVHRIWEPKGIATEYDERKVERLLNQEP